MKINPLIITLLICCTAIDLYAQSANTSFPDGIYYTLGDFMQQNPDTTKYYKKLNLGINTSKAFMDTIVDHVWFLDNKNDRIDKVFAIVHQGEIYFQDNGIKQNLMPEFGQKVAFSKEKYHRVQFRGRYLYGESNYQSTDPTATILAAAMFGMVGGLIAAGATEIKDIELPFVFDTKYNKFFALHSKIILQSFMDKYHADEHYDVEKGKMDIEVVKQLIKDLNLNEMK